MVVDYLFQGLVPLITGAGVALLACWLWFIEPLIHRTNGPGRS
jgi:hypothetical protein